jgi:peptidoglycan/LPS O-acetylase OafA/YrhL
MEQPALLLAKPPTRPTPTPRLHGLDHLRALAITLVVVFHYGRLFAAPAVVTAMGKFGWTGVDLFFVLSGYLISSQLLVELEQTQRLAVASFFTKRFFRIVPLYSLILALYFFVPGVREREALAPLWKYVTFTQNLGLDLRTQGTFSHAWSLCIEEQFYLVLPLVLGLLGSYRHVHKLATLLVAGMIAGLLVRLVLWSSWVGPLAATADGGAIVWYTWIYYPTFCRLDGLFVGVLLALALQPRAPIARQLVRAGNWWVGASMLLLAGAYYVCRQEQSVGASVWGFPLVSLGYGALVLGALSPGSMLYRRSSRVTRKLADLSFAIYLSHKILLHLTQEQASAWGLAKASWPMLLLCVASTLLGAYLLHHLIEQPFLRLRNRILRKGQQA